MQIIGITKGGAILSATTQEVARIIGTDSMYGVARDMIADPNANIWEKQFKVGTEIKVDAMWDWMKKARETFKKIEDTGKLLFGLAEVLSHSPPAALVEPEPAEDERKPA